MKYLTFLQGNYVIPRNPKNTFPWLAIVNQPPIRLIIPYISFIYSTSTTTLAIQITKRLRGCEVIRLQRYVKNLLTNAKDRTKSLKQIKYLINLPNQTNQALRLNKQTNQRPDFCLICLFTRLHLLGQHISIYSTPRLVRILIREFLDNGFSKIPNQDETGTGAASIV
jgi:hypothetical protein